jgi:hypothetical protein
MAVSEQKGSTLSQRDARRQGMPGPQSIGACAAAGDPLGTPVSDSVRSARPPRSARAVRYWSGRQIHVPDASSRGLLPHAPVFHLTLYHPAPPAAVLLLPALPRSSGSADLSAPGC